MQAMISYIKIRKKIYMNIYPKILHFQNIIASKRDDWKGILLRIKRQRRNTKIFYFVPNISSSRSYLEMAFVFRKQGLKSKRWLLLFCIQLFLPSQIGWMDRMNTLLSKRPIRPYCRNPQTFVHKTFFLFLSEFASAQHHRENRENVFHL